MCGLNVFVHLMIVAVSTVLEELTEDSAWEVTSLECVDWYFDYCLFVALTAYEGTNIDEEQREVCRRSAKRRRR